jgi:hypothetical protein
LETGSNYHHLQCTYVPYNLQVDFAITFVDCNHQISTAQNEMQLVRQCMVLSN